MRFSIRWRMASAALMTLVALAPLTSVRGQEEEQSDSHKGFIVSFDEAKKKASQENKDILIEFTGSDWCVYCKMLEKEVLSTETFLEHAPKDYVLLMIDSPNDKSHQSKEEQIQAEKLIAQYKISGFPTLVLADAEGKPYATMGYDGSKPDEYVQNLKSKAAIRKTRDEMLAQAAKAEGVAKAELLAKAIKDIDPEMAVQSYRAEIDQIIELDPENQSGMKDKFVALVKETEIVGEMEKIFQGLRTGSVEEALAKIDDLIEASQPAPELHQKILFVKAKLLFNSDEDKSKSKETLLTALKLAPDSDVAREIESVLKQEFSDEDK